MTLSDVEVHMKNRTLLLALTASLTVTGSVVAQQSIPTLPPSAVGGHVGKVATVCGVIVHVSCSDKGRGVQFDMEEPYYQKVRFAVTDADQPRLGPRLARFLFQPLCGTGIIKKRNGGFLLEAKPEDMLQKGPAGKVPPAFEREAFTSCDEWISLPTLLREVPPQYTAEALNAKKRGRVLLLAVVLPDGHVGDVVVAVSLDREYGLDDQAVAALKQWVFKPGTLRGQPVPVIVSVELAFNLRD